MNEEASDLLSKTTIFITYFQYVTVMTFGYIEEFLGKLSQFFFGQDGYFTTPAGYAPLLKDWEYFWTRRIYRRIRDCWDRPVCSAPGARIDVVKRVSKDSNATFEYPGEKINCLNLGSYNYLGFADGYCNPEVIRALHKYGASVCSPRFDKGHTEIHEKLEQRVARYLKKEAAVVFGMGFNTNSTCLPNLIGKGGLVISDSLNHCSLVVGCRSSGAKIKVFRHNDFAHLEQILRESIVEGQPRTHRPWTKILIVIEGIYSMEGEIVELPKIIELKKKYKAYLYLDEAHSIGALGKRGGGVTEYWGVDTADIDIMMGTFTKSFGAVGGYIAGSKDLITYIKRTSFSSLYDTHMSAPCAQQALSALTVIMGDDGTSEGQRRLAKLRENCRFFRKGLEDLGFALLGNEDSPVIPLLLIAPSKISYFSRMCLERNIAVVVVGFPATSILMSRSRFCVSAAHEKKDLEEGLKVLDEVGDMVWLKYRSGTSYHV